MAAMRREGEGRPVVYPWWGIHDAVSGVKKAAGGDTSIGFGRRHREIDPKVNSTGSGQSRLEGHG